MCYFLLGLSRAKNYRASGQDYFILSGFRPGRVGPKVGISGFGSGRVTGHHLAIREFLKKRDFHGISKVTVNAI